MSAESDCRKIDVILKTPSFIPCENNNVIIIDAEKPVWLKTSITGKWLFDLINVSPIIVEDVLIKAANYYELPEEAIRQPIIDFLGQLENSGFITLGSEENTNIHSKTENDCREIGCANDLISKFGLISVWFNVLSQCNLSCHHCFLAEEKNSKPISFEKAQYVIDNITTLNPKRLYISGGEPLLHPYLLKIVQYAKQQHDWQMILVTNGFSDNTRLIEELSEFIDYFQISIDGVNAETHDAVRGINSFKKAVNIFSILHSIHSKAKRGISFTPHPTNVHQIPQLYKLATELKADGIYITKPKIPRRNHIDNQWNNDEFLSFQFREKVFEYYDQLVKEYLENYKNLSSFKHINLPVVDTQFDPALNLLTPIKRACCGAGGSVLFINERGDCYPCVALAQKENLLGNIFDNPIKEIYEKKGVEEFRQHIHVDHIPECQACVFKYICAGDCRALSGNVNERSPFCELIKSRYKRFLNGITVPN